MRIEQLLAVPVNACAPRTPSPVASLTSSTASSSSSMFPSSMSPGSGMEFEVEEFEWAEMEYGEDGRDGECQWVEEGDESEKSGMGKRKLVQVYACGLGLTRSVHLSTSSDALHNYNITYHHQQWLCLLFLFFSPIPVVVHPRVGVRCSGYEYDFGQRQRRGLWL